MIQVAAHSIDHVNHLRHDDIMPMIQSCHLLTLTNVAEYNEAKPTYYPLPSAAIEVARLILDANGFPGRRPLTEMERISEPRLSAQNNDNNITAAIVNSVLEGLESVGKQDQLEAFSLSVATKLLGVKKGKVLPLVTVPTGETDSTLWLSPTRSPTLTRKDWTLNISFVKP